MKAIRFHEFGAPGVLRYEDAPKPAVRPGEVLVRVHAAGLNRERDEHPTFPFAIAAARTAPSPIGAERDGRRSR